MLRHDMVEIVGKEFLTSNIEAGEYSYVQAAGGKAQLEAKVGHPVSHFKLDIRFEMDDVVVLIETKQNYVDDDEKQLREYLEEERAIHPGNKAICVLANTNNDKIKVWKSFVDDEHVLKDEAMLDRMAHYVRLFRINKSNDRETVLRNTYSLNELLHKKDIDENLRSQFVGTSLLYIKDLVKKKGTVLITKEFVDSMKEFWSLMTPKGIRGAIEGVLSDLLDDSDNKAKKIELLQKNVLGNQKVRALKTTDWVEILETIMLDIYRYIDTDSSEGQDILNMFFIAFNKYTGKREKDGKPRKTVKMAVLLPVATAIGTKSIIQNEKIAMLENNTLEAVFTLPNEIFYPGASASACCMVFTLGEPHVKVDGTTIVLYSFATDKVLLDMQIIWMEYCWITSACQTPMETHGVINMESPISFLQSKKL